MPDLTRLRDQYDAMLIDLDGTLLGKDGEVTPRTAKAIHALRRAGMRVLICTGRSAPGAFPAHGELELDEPVIAYNGSWIGVPGAEPELRIPIPAQTIEPLAVMEAHAEFTFRCDGTHKYTVQSVHADYARVAAWYEMVRTVEHHELPGDDLMRISMFFEGSGSALDLDEELGEDLGGMIPADQASDAPHHTHWEDLGVDVREALRREWFPLRLFPPYRHSVLEMCEIVGASRGKAEGVFYLADRHGIPAERVIAVGDQRNDLPMHEAAGLAVAMGNAVADVKAAADIVIGHHAQDGLAEWIEAGAPRPLPGATS